MNKSDLKEVLAYGGLAVADLKPEWATMLFKEPHSDAERNLQERQLCRTFASLTLVWKHGKGRTVIVGDTE